MNYDKINERQNINNSGMINPPHGSPGIEQGLYGQSNMMENMMTYQLCYPEIFYKLQPFIMMACDQMDTYGPMMPSQEMIEQMSDNIYEDVNRMYPDMAEYVRDYENKSKSDSPDTEVINHVPGIYGGPGMFGRRFRRRGVFRDLIGILLLSELFRRRRRYY